LFILKLYKWTKVWAAQRFALAGIVPKGGLPEWDRAAWRRGGRPYNNRTRHLTAWAYDAIE